MKEKHFCKNCKGLRKHKVLFEKKLAGAEEEIGFNYNDDYYVIECLGCENISFLHIYCDLEMVEYGDNGEIDYSENINIYPSYLENGREIEHLYYLPNEIKIIYEETLTAFKIKAYILTAGGFRAIIEALCNYLKIKKDDLSKRIDLLHKKGYLSLNESNRLHSIRFLGNDALHEIETPKKRSLLIILEIVNHLLENLFIQDKQIANNVDRIVDQYDSFIALLKYCIVEHQLNKELSLNEILAKKRRLIKGGVFESFELQLKEQIKNGNIDFLSIIQNGDKVVYKVEKIPPGVFDLW